MQDSSACVVQDDNEDGGNKGKTCGLSRNACRRVDGWFENLKKLEYL